MANDFTQSITNLNAGVSADFGLAVLWDLHRTSAIQSMVRALNGLNEVGPICYANVYFALVAQCHKVFYPLVRHFGDNSFSHLENIIGNRHSHESSSARLFTEYALMQNADDYVMQSQRRSVSCKRAIQQMFLTHGAGNLQETLNAKTEEIMDDLDSFLKDFSDWYNFEREDHDMDVRASNVFPGNPER